MNSEKWIILDALVGIILFYRKGCVVEIGVGSSTDILAKHAKKANVPLYTCDLNKNISPLFNKHFHFNCSSLHFINQFDSIPSVVFLDGNHDYDVTIKEVEFFLDKMIIGGVIFMHDTYPPSEQHLTHKYCSDSYKLRQEYEKRIDIVDCFTWPYTSGNCGLTMMIKKDPKRPYYKR